MKEIDYNAIGSRIRAFRKHAGITQQRLAEISGQEPSNISHIERGATKLGLPTIVSIANALGVTVDQLLCDSVDTSRHVFESELAEFLSDCTDDELKFIISELKSLKENVRKYLK